MSPGSPPLIQPLVSARTLDNWPNIRSSTRQDRTSPILCPQTYSFRSGTLHRVPPSPISPPLSPVMVSPAAPWLAAPAASSPASPAEPMEMARELAMRIANDNRGRRTKRIVGNSAGRLDVMVSACLFSP